MKRKNTPAQVLVIRAMDVFNELERSKVLMNAWWNHYEGCSMSDQEMYEMELLLTVYEQRRDEYLCLMKEILQELHKTVF